jgi:hypothetical protein
MYIYIPKKDARCDSGWIGMLYVQEEFLEEGLLIV